MNPTKIFSTRTAIPSIFRTVQLGIVFAGLACLVVPASITTPASAQAVNFGKVNVCPAGKTTPAPCNANQTVTFSIPAGTSIGSIAIVTTGIADLDFKAEADDTSTTLCRAQTYSSATTCTVDVTFAALAPGARNGAVELVDASSKVIAMTYVYGVGVGPEITFSPAAQVYRGTGFAHAYGVGGAYGVYGLAVDAGGNIFVADGTIQEVLVSGGHEKMKTLTSAGFNGVVAVDGAGNVFAQNGGTPGITEFEAIGDYTTTKLINDGPVYADGLAVDGSGNIFASVSNSFHTGVEELLAADGYVTIKTIGSGFQNPLGLAVDAADNVFVADFNNNAIKEILAEGGYTTVKTLGPKGMDWEGPRNVAVDAEGNVYVANGPVYEIPAAGGYTTVETVWESSYGADVVAVGPTGDLFAGNDYGPDANVVTVLQRSKPLALDFSATAVNASSSDNPLSITMQNLGNTTFTGSGLTLSDATDFALVDGSGTPEDCTSDLSLAPDAKCNLSIDFAPKSAGELSSSLALTTNAGNVTLATLSGNGITPGGPVAHVSATSLNFGTLAYPATATLALTITNTGGGKLIVNPFIDGPSYQVASSTCGSGVTTGSCVLQIEFNAALLGSGFHPSAGGPHHDTLTLATNGPTNPTVALTGAVTGILTQIPSLDFGVVSFPASPTIEFLVFNYGVAAGVTVQFSFSGPSFKVASTDCRHPGIPAGSTNCHVVVQFTPTTLGTHIDTLTLTPSSGGPSRLTVTGTAVGTLE